jgi:Fe-S oxidoreductase
MIPGIELVEMQRNRENSFCCGGGQGNFYLDLLHGGENSPSRIRIREAHETGAHVVAVACPACMCMLNDAVKTEGLDDELVVRDISEIVQGIITC